MADHTSIGLPVSAVTQAERYIQSRILTDATSPDVVVRVRGRVVPVRVTGTGVDAVVPVATEQNGVVTHSHLFASFA